MANKVEELTINYSEDGVQKVRELDKHVLTRGAWSTIMYLYEDRTRSDEPFSAPKITIRRYRKISGEYRQQSKFNIGSLKQAGEIRDILDRWYRESGN